MILRSLELKHFGKFSERSFDFRRGFNLVVGANESGKSTMMEAIPAALFGLRDKDRYKPWGRQGSCEAALSLENGGCTVRIERELLSDRVQLVERDDLYQVLYQFDGKAAPKDDLPNALNILINSTGCWPWLMKIFFDRACFSVRVIWNWLTATA